MARVRVTHALALALVFFAPIASAQSFNKGSHLNASGQSKVNKALAKGWAAGDPSVKEENRTVVNIGNRKAGDCTVNIGTTQAAKPGQQAPREVVVTAKEVINVCK